MSYIARDVLFIFILCITVGMFIILISYPYLSVDIYVGVRVGMLMYRENYTQRRNLEEQQCEGYESSLDKSVRELKLWQTIKNFPSPFLSPFSKHFVQFYIETDFCELSRNDLKETRFVK